MHASYPSPAGLTPLMSPRVGHCSIAAGGQGQRPAHGCAMPAPQLPRKPSMRAWDPVPTGPTKRITGDTVGADAHDNESVDAPINGRVVYAPWVSRYIPFHWLVPGRDPGRGPARVEVLIPAGLASTIPRAAAAPGPRGRSTLETRRTPRTVCAPVLTGLLTPVEPD